MTESRHPLSQQVRKQTTFGGDVARLVSGTVIAQIVSFIVTPVITRLYTPNYFGTYAVFVSITGILTIITCLRYDYAILLPEDNKEAANVFFVSVISILVTGLTSAFFLYLSAARLATLLNIQSLSSYWWLVLLTIILNGLFLALRAWSARFRHFKWISTANVASSIVSAGLQLGLGLLGRANSNSLITAYVLGTFVSTLVIGIYVLKSDVRLLLDSFNRYEMWRLAIRYRKFPLVDTWGAFFNNLSWQLPPLLLSSFFGLSVAGYYSLAYRIVQVPMALVGSSIAQVFYQRVSEFQSDAKSVTSIVEATFHKLSVLGMFPALLATVMGPEIFLLIFGPEWREAGVYFQILGIWTLFWFISSPLSTVFIVMERQGSLLLFTSANLVTRFVALYTGGIYHSARFALLLFAISGVAIYGGILLGSFKLAGVHKNAIIRRQNTNLVLSIIMTASVLIAKLALPTEYNSLTLALSGGATLLLYGYLFRAEANYLLLKSPYTKILEYIKRR